MLRKSLLVVVALAALSVSANAADMPLKAERYRAADPWVGYYLGLNLMGAWLDAKTDVTTPVVTTTKLSSSGVTGGIQVGYNWVFDRQWLVGWEADIDATAISGNSTAVVAGFTVNTHAKVPFFGTVRGRVGKITDYGLFYVTGGLLYTDVKTRVVSSAGTLFEDQELQWGWAVGAGAEKFFTDRISAKLEYLYLSPADTTVSALGATTITHVTGHSVRLGVNYHFH